MRNLDVSELDICHICSSDLLPHPLFIKSGAKYCPRDGDFFVYRQRGEKATVIFKPYDKKSRIYVHDTVFVRIARVINESRISPYSEYLPRETRGPGQPGMVIRCEQTGEIFKSLWQASKAMGISVGSLSLHMNGHKRHAKGYTFVKVDPFVKDDTVYPLKKRMSYTGGIPRIRLLCHETGKEYPSIRGAARETGINYNRLLEHLNQPHKYPSVQGYTFHKMDE